MDRPWPQFGLLVGVTAIILSTIMLIVTLQQPFRSEGIHIGLERYDCCLGVGIPGDSRSCVLRSAVTPVLHADFAVVVEGSLFGRT